MKLLNIKFHDRHFKDTIHKALTMWIVGDSVCLLLLFAHINRSHSISRSLSSVVLRRPHSLNIFSETTALDRLKPSQDGKSTVCIIGPGYTNKMVVMLIYGKKLSFILLLQNP